jgi:hypothetical protein
LSQLHERIAAENRREKEAILPQGPSDLRQHARHVIGGFKAPRLDESLKARGSQRLGLIVEDDINFASRQDIAGENPSLWAKSACLGFENVRRGAMNEHRLQRPVNHGNAIGELGQDDVMEKMRNP